MSNRRFNSDRLLWARALRGISQTELARLSELSQGAVSQFENGLKEPAEETLERLAAILSLPVSFFDRPTGRRHIPVRFYRKKASVLRRNVEKFEAEVSALVEHLTVLLRSVELEAPLVLPRLDVATYGTVENVAAALRSAWGIPSGPIRNLAQYAEAAGILVIPVQLEFEGVDGLGLRYSDVPPIILLDANVSADRQRLTLSHEIGHMVMHDIPSPTDEEQAKQFQREFLAPARELRRELTPVSLLHLGQLKQRWGISMSALLYAAHQLGYINKGRYIGMKNDLRAHSSGKREPEFFDIPFETPTLFPSLIDHHLSHLNYTPAELAAAMDLLVDEFHSRYRQPTGTLRLVRD